MPSHTPSHHPAPPIFLTMRDAQHLLRLDDNTIYKLLHAGELDYTHIGRCLRIYYDSVVAYGERKRTHDNQ
jgi:excisionase family DNA binding protein